MVAIHGINFSLNGKGRGACTINPQLVNDYPSGDTRGLLLLSTWLAKASKVNLIITDQREYTGVTVKKYTPVVLPDGTTDTGGIKDLYL